MSIYHPWRDARDRRHLTIRLVDHLPTGHRGRITGDEIHIRRHQGSGGRRSTLAHELFHDERRVFPRDAVLRAREELAVERIAARRLIAIDRLVEVLRWTRQTDEVAEELGSTSRCSSRWFSRSLPASGRTSTSSCAEGRTSR